MTNENFSNGSQTTLNGAVNNSQTTGTLTSASGWPAAPFRALITAEGGNTDEIIYVGGRSGTSLTGIIRAVEPIADGTQVAQAHSSGATITQVLTAAAVTALTVPGVFNANSPTYGCKPNDSAFDNAALITTVIADAVTFAAANNCVAVVEFDSGEYWVKGSIGAGAGNNWSQIPLPVITTTSPKVVLILRPKIGSAMGLDNGVQTTIQPGVVIFRTNLTGQSYDGTHGIPSILGGPTYQKTSSFSNMQLVLQSIGFRTPANPTLCGVDASRLANVIFENCRWDTADSPSSGITQPTHPTGMANLVPLNNNNAVADYRGLNQAIGWYTGVSIGEHTQAEKLFAYQCYVAFNIEGDYYHAAQVEHASAEWCTYVLASVDPPSGLVNPSGASGYCIMNINLLDIEDAVSGWGVPTYHINDPGNDYYGRIRYMRVLAGTGTQTGALTLNGATHLSLDDLTVLPATFVNPMTTQDDIIVGGSSGALSRLAKGSDSQVLTIDPTSHHVSWAASSGGGGGGSNAGTFVGAKAYHSTTQAITSGGDTAVLLDSEEFDSNGFHSTSSNTSRMTIPTGYGGKYLLIGFLWSVTNQSSDCRFRVNGSTLSTDVHFAQAAGNAFTWSTVLTLSDADYVEVVVTPAGSMTLGNASAAEAKNSFTIVKLDIPSFIGVAAYNSTTQTVANTTETKLTFNSEDYDTSTIHDNSTNPTRFTVPTGGAGKWTAVAYCSWDANASGTVRYMWWSLNGTRIRSSLVSNPGAGFGLDQRSTLEPVTLADGDYVEVSAYQDSGGTRTTGAASGDQRNAVTFWRVG